MTTQVTRVTMVKIAEDKIDTALKGFEIFVRDQKKDGNPYILSMQAGRTGGHVKDQGYTFVTKSVFKNMEDMEYYSTKCEAHEAFKVYLKENAPVEGLMSVFFTPEASWEAETTS